MARVTSARAAGTVIIAWHRRQSLGPLSTTGSVRMGKCVREGVRVDSEGIL